MTEKLKVQDEPQQDNKDKTIETPLNNDDVEESAESKTENRSNNVRSSKKKTIIVFVILVLIGALSAAIFLLISESGGQTDNRSDSGQTQTNTNEQQEIFEPGLSLGALTRDSHPLLDELVYPFYEARQQGIDFASLTNENFHAQDSNYEHEEEWIKDLSEFQFEVVFISTNPRVSILTGSDEAYNEMRSYEFLVNIFDKDDKFITRESGVINEYADTNKNPEETKSEIERLNYYETQLPVIELDDGTRAVVIKGLDGEADKPSSPGILSAVRSPGQSCGKYTDTIEPCLIVTNENPLATTNWNEVTNFPGHFDINSSFERSKTESNIIFFESGFGDGGFTSTNIGAYNLINNKVSEAVSTFGIALEFVIGADNETTAYDSYPDEIEEACQNYADGYSNEHGITLNDNTLNIVSCQSQSDNNANGSDHTFFIIFDNAVIKTLTIEDQNIEGDAVDLMPIENARLLSDDKAQFSIFDTSYSFKFDDASLEQI